MPHIHVHWARLDDGRLGTHRGHRIWLDPRQRQAQRRSTLTHELVHLHRGDDGCQSPSAEVEVERAAARLLIPLDALARAIAWARCEQDLADELHVDIAMVRARLAGLSPGERWQIEDVVGRREEPC